MILFVREGIQAFSGAGCACACLSSSLVVNVVLRPEIKLWGFIWGRERDQEKEKEGSYPLVVKVGWL